MAKHNLISVDLAKNVFQVCGMAAQNKIVFNKQLKKKDLAEFMASQSPVEVAMEACYSSHYWGNPGCQTCLFALFEISNPR